jgi:probable DNA metabolism protein
MFERRLSVKTDQARASRVWKGLKNHLGSKHRQKLLHAYLSGHPNVEMLIYQRVADAIAQRRNPSVRVRLAAILQIDKLSQKVRREAHRLKGFVRFEQTCDGRYVALIAPRYDVLPLIRRHFETRFADQQWIIYDTHRKYGIGYSDQNPEAVPVEHEQVRVGVQDKNDREELCQALWRCYFKAANIDRRNNPTLHQSRLPKRYWKYLTEKRF